MVGEDATDPTAHDAGMPLWFKLGLFGAGLVLLAIIVLHLLGYNLGGHGP